MCDTCGCDSHENKIRIQKPGEQISDPMLKEHHHHHDHKHGHSHTSDSRLIKVETNILSKNDQLAERNKEYFEAKNIFALNIMSSPGSGKTTLLEKTIKSLLKDHNIAVIEGDQQSLNDALRIESAGAPVIQVNTGNGCHLDADMIHKAIHKLKLQESSMLFIENVGNLVCPALFDLGEAKRVVIISVTEGDDKPQKYPNIFETSQVCIINKTDLLPYVDFDIEKAKAHALRLNPHLEFIELSAKSGEGMEQWFQWLNTNLKTLNYD